MRNCPEVLSRGLCSFVPWEDEPHRLASRNLWVGNVRGEDVTIEASCKVWVFLLFRVFEGSCCVLRPGTEYQGSGLELEALETWGIESSGYGAFGLCFRISDLRLTLSPKPETLNPKNDLGQPRIALIWLSCPFQAKLPSVVNSFPLLRLNRAPVVRECLYGIFALSSLCL